MATCSSILAWRSPEQRRLAGYSLCGCKKLDMAERLTLLLLLQPRYFLPFSGILEFLFGNHVPASLDS